MHNLFQILQLIRSEHIGPVTFYQLVNHYQSISEVIARWGEVAKKGPYVLADPKKIEAEIRWHEKNGARLVTYLDQDYPPLLKVLPDAPPVLSVWGQEKFLSTPAIGIVGARNASLNGQKLAYCFARDIGKHTWTIVSGLARGIDKSAHEGSLATGTIAILAGGVDNIYPPEHRKLYHQIIEQGLVLSEMEPHTIPQARHFPRRNRLISGISKGIVVVEAAFQSGSLLTATYAANQGREVFAVPGSPLDPRCRGTNLLLKQGAHLVEGANDVLDIIGSERKAEVQPSAAQTAAPIETDLLLEALSPAPTEIDLLIAQTGLSASQVWVRLSELELEGKVERHEGHKVSRVEYQILKI